MGTSEVHTVDMWHISQLGSFSVGRATWLVMCAALMSTANSSRQIPPQMLQHLNQLTKGTASPPPPTPQLPTRVVDTPDGKYLVDRVPSKGNGWLRARGIQYAEHPVGDLRWQPPVPMVPTVEVKEALDYGDDCINAPWYNVIIGIGLRSGMSEKCLYLNVYAPLDESGNISTPKPVMVWFYGGSFVFGGSDKYNGDGMFEYRRDVVIVTVNYRLGALGFLGGETIASSTSDGSSGNFALQDTRAALMWVQKNIASFGGDPSTVTIFGESAGSSLVECHLVAPKSNGLFHRAIMQSGAFDNYTIQAEPDLHFKEFVSYTNCKASLDKADLMKCLRAIPIIDATDTGLYQAISKSDADGIFSPEVDGVELMETPEMSAATGKFNKVDAVIAGTNLNEGRFLMPLTMPVPNAPDSSEEDLRAWLSQNYDPDYTSDITKFVNEAIKIYSDYLQENGAWETASKMYTDSQYRCPTERSIWWLNKFGAVNATSSFVYQLTHKPKIMDTIGPILFLLEWCDLLIPCENMTKVSMGVGHTSDVFMLWNNSDQSDEDRIVGRTMIDFWQSFAATGAPRKLPHYWPPYGSQNLTLDLNIETSANTIYQDRCNFWHKVHRVPYTT